MKIYRIALSCLGLIAATASHAADLGSRNSYGAAAPEYSWSGFYLGGHLGYHRAPVGGNLSGYTGYAAGFFERNGLTKFGLDPKGVIGGGQFGYNYQTGRFILGAEADISVLAHISKGQSAAASRFVLNQLAVTQTETLSAKSQVNWLATFRGRLGYAVTDRFMVFGTGGLAFSQIRASAAQVSVVQTVPLNGGTTTASSIDNASSASWTKTGWALGAGAEVAISRSITLRADYLYYSLGDNVLTIRDKTNAALSTSYKFQNRGDIFRLGINYLF